MKIGILGSGDVGHALGRGFVSRGHDTMMGSRDPNGENVQSWVKASGPRARAGSLADAARFAEMAVLCTAWSGTKSAIDLAGPDNLRGKVVIDVTNPLAFAEGKPPGLAPGHTDSGGEQVQRWLPGSRVVKAFNSVGNGHMVDPQFPGGPPDMFICGNDDDAKKAVVDICSSFGWPAIDIGGIEGARVLEPLCILWVIYAMRNGSRDHAFKLLRK
jgi:predicted dinucleotide-binding enzyme